MQNFRIFGGKWVDPKANAWTKIAILPIGTHPICLAPRSNADDVSQAVTAADRAFPAWSTTPPQVRAELRAHAARKIAEQKEPFAAGMCREMGKVLTESRGDVQEAIDIAVLHVGRRTPDCSE